ncbi:MAG: DNA/RNA non-specific endonuclease, partial [Prevotella sp.]|nr:DNA/RNA non-specific endonuclease [Prevotella sp.]
MKRLLYILLPIFVAMSATAQTTRKIRTVTLKTDVSFSFNDTTQDSIRIIYTPSGDTLGIKIYQNNVGSSDFLYSQIASIAYWETAIPSDTDTINVNKNDANDLMRNPEAWRKEFPRLVSGDSLCFEVTHSTTDYGITYSLEWDGTKRANRWTCYELYPDNMVKNTSRQDNFAEDESIPAEYRTTLSDYSNSGYTRGHLCPSADRLCSAEQNSQTFLLSNMQPQISSHNSGVWATLEDKVRNSWAPVAGSEDTLYVVKAATIDDANIMGYTTSNLIVPKYFYMALLYYSKSTNT